jgi:REP element-mobilizing transposase RayT
MRNEGVIFWQPHFFFLTLQTNNTTYMPKEIKTFSICEDANGDNARTIFVDTDCDSELYFDKNDFDHFEWGTHLPHWHQDGKYVFVTFRLHDSLPQEKLQWLRDEKESWLKRHPQPWDKSTTKEYIDKFGRAVDKWLDNNYGNCLLKKTTNRKIVEDALLFFDGKRYELIAYVVMPNHVHILMKLKEGHELTEIMRSIKSFTAKKINENEKSTGPMWQSESYDRLIRDQKHFENVVRYIIANNKKLAWVANNNVNDCVPQSKE